MSVMHLSQAVEMTWSRERSFDRFVLRAEDSKDVRATLVHQRGSWFMGETDGGRWSFRRAGLLRSRVVIRAVETGIDLAVLHINAGWDGALEFANGARFHWRMIHFWRHEHVILDARNQPVLKARLTRGGNIQVLVLDQAVAELPMLLMMAAYLTMTTTDSTALTTGATVAGV